VFTGSAMLIGGANFTAELVSMLMELPNVHYTLAPLTNEQIAARGGSCAADAYFEFDGGTGYLMRRVW
jgi:hypothetical protein